VFVVGTVEMTNKCGDGCEGVGCTVAGVFASGDWAW
jgi:hypothetical protein